MAGIKFKLTPEIIDQIIFGMENQDNSFYVDINSGTVVPEGSADRELIERDVLIPVPDWRPADGFQMMEGFVASLHNPVYRESLRDVLNAGKGVFRHFKKTLREFQPLSRQWYTYKERSMRNIVVEWYNLNSEILKYQDIQENTDETDSLILEDFVFTVDSTRWAEILDSRREKSVRESLGDENVLVAEYLLERMKDPLPENSSSVVVTAESSYGDFAGFVHATAETPGIGQEVLLVVDLIWVEPQFRGLGIARHLLELITESAGEQGASKILFSLSGTAVTLLPALEALGAVSVLSGLVIDLS